jgi:hypothetical protein
MRNFIRNVINMDFINAKVLYLLQGITSVEKTCVWYSDFSVNIIINLVLSGC